MGPGPGPGGKIGPIGSTTVFTLPTVTLPLRAFPEYWYPRPARREPLPRGPVICKTTRSPRRPLSVSANLST